MPSSNQGQRYCIEVEFLVAVERRGGVYEEFDLTTGASPRDARWSCPDTRTPYPVVLEHIRGVLAAHGQTVTIHPTRDQHGGLTWSSREARSWVLTPATYARQQLGCPGGYHWIGIKLRSPVLREPDSGSTEPRVPPCLDDLRRAVRMHVNSTCAFNVMLLPSGRPFSLNYLKKLSSLVWLLEPDMLLALRPSALPPAASLVYHANVRYPPASSVRCSGYIMEAYVRHTVELHDYAVQACINRLCADVPDLCAALRDRRDGRPLAFSLHVLSPTQQAPHSDGSRDCIVLFQYALWHPYANLDASEYWIELALTLGDQAAVTPREYRTIVWEWDQIIRESYVQNQGWAIRCKLLLESFGWTEDYYKGWAEIVLAYISTA
ncbi:hypothetical protein HIM_09261 [Hirsutella minnesotensis 3608]|uniref:Uncharacterized protein n=1 Tax=Hirsutella minnesotensis 3608 TaxID=1043627 RepID=A0A0F7ZLP8_9HYPO|nr:hypothetical protein HIM_09261 [Hirsutella minnesotensis 3608]